MPRAFLPPPSPGTSYPVTPTAGDFAAGDAGLLSHIGANMAVAEAQTEGRVPSPLSRAYMFYTALFGRSLAMTGNQSLDDKDRLATEGRRALQTQARATFRGLCAVFALRDALGLEVELRSIPLVAADNEVARVLQPNLNGAPGGAAYWQRVRLFTARARHGGPAQVIAGLSPLTGVFPAANPPARALAGVFWYTPPTDHTPTGVWHDPTSARPTGGSTPLSPTTASVVRAALAEWVRHVADGYRNEDLEQQGVSKQGARLLRAELDAWKADLASVPSVEGVGVVQGAVAAPPGEPVPPFLLAACVGVGGAVLSDLPLHHGRLIVSSSALGDATKRVWGPVFGARNLGDRVAALDRSGPNLGAALGLGDGAAPVPFVVLDKLFTPKLTVLTQNGVSDEWRALPVAGGGAGEFALFPFEPEVLELLTPDELAEWTSAEMSQDTLHYKVRLKVGTQEVVQLYATSQDGPHALDDKVIADTLDLRLFPNFDLDAVRDVLPMENGERPDARYYARARLGPDWSFGIRALHIDHGDGDARSVTTAAASQRRGDTQAGTNGAVPPGEADFFTLDRKPDGFWFERRGLCLLRLPRPPAAGNFTTTWDVGVDFGTSNSCVAFRPADRSEKPRPFVFPVLTTTLLKTPTYGAISSSSGDQSTVNEGHSAVADFFFKLSADDRDLVSPAQYPDAATPYFPTQIVTQQQQLPDGSSTFDLSAGLILFQNGVLSGVGLLEILNGFELESDSNKLTKRFHLKQDIKWSQRTWLRAFMAHLRLQVVLTAARQNARIERVLFSYPKAFSHNEETAYERALKNAWGPLYAGLSSESEAVQTTLGGTANQHLVLDVGGGTTDVIGFDQGTPAFQTSFKLAAGQVNAYVAASPAFRAAFRDAIEEAGVRKLSGDEGGLTLRMFAEGTETQLLNVWVGLLQALEYDDPTGGTLSAVIGKLSETAQGDGADARAVRGFFLTTTLLFGGLAYAVGRLQGMASAGHLAGPAFDLTSVRIALTGNGSKLVNLLSSSREPFDRVFSRLFRAGLTRAASAGDGASAAETVRVDFDGVYTLENGVPAPKTTVALGLLAGDGERGDDEVPVANAVLEGGDAMAPGDSLVTFYDRVRRRDSAFTPGSEAPPELAAFLDTLNQALPNGYNRKFMVIPGVGPDWHEPLKTDLFAAARGALLDRLATNAAGLPTGSDTQAGAAYVPAMEPVLIAEIAALLDQIREDYA